MLMRFSMREARSTRPKYLQIAVLSCMKVPSGVWVYLHQEIRRKSYLWLTENVDTKYQINASISAVSQRSNRSSWIMPGGGKALILIMTERSHSQTSLALKALQFKKKPYPSRCNILYLNFFWELEILRVFLHVVKSSKALCRWDPQAAWSLSAGSSSPKTCMRISIPLSSSNYQKPICGIHYAALYSFQIAEWVLMIAHIFKEPCISQGQDMTTKHRQVKQRSRCTSLQRRRERVAHSWFIKYGQATGLTHWQCPAIQDSVCAEYNVSAYRHWRNVSPQMGLKSKAWQHACGTNQELRTQQLGIWGTCSYVL